MKKFLITILTVTLLFALISCNGDILIKNEAAATESSTYGETSHPDIGLIGAETDRLYSSTESIFYPLYFSAVIKKINDDGTLLIDVCSEYVKFYGKTTTIIPPEGFTATVGSEVYIQLANLSSSSILRAQNITPVEELAVPEKPVIYLYPTEKTNCSVRIDFDGRLTCTYPEHGESGWIDFTAYPDGTLIFPDGKEYYCLYWEGEMQATYDFSKGVCVKGSDTAKYLEYALSAMGLTPREANEFIIYWLPVLQNNPYNVISFQAEAYTDKAKLEIAPNPDSLLRVFMAAYASDEFIEIEPQEFCTFDRVGFTVVEWGGSIVNNAHSN